MIVTENYKLPVCRAARPSHRLACCDHETPTVHPRAWVARAVPLPQALLPRYPELEHIPANPIAFDAHHQLGQSSALVRQPILRFLFLFVTTIARPAIIPTMVLQRGHCRGRPLNYRVTPLLWFLLACCRHETLTVSQDRIADYCAIESRTTCARNWHNPPQQAQSMKRTIL